MVLGSGCGSPAPAGRWCALTSAVVAGLGVHQEDPPRGGERDEPNTTNWESHKRVTGKLPRAAHHAVSGPRVTLSEGTGGQGLTVTCTWSKWFAVGDPRSAIGFQPMVGSQ